VFLPSASPPACAALAVISLMGMRLPSGTGAAASTDASTELPVASSPTSSSISVHSMILCV